MNQQRETPNRIVYVEGIRLEFYDDRVEIGPSAGSLPVFPPLDGIKVTSTMVDRFLAWRLPADFHPDAGISFKASYNETSPFGPSEHEPTGTNLLSADQARAMLAHVLGAE